MDGDLALFIVRFAVVALAYLLGQFVQYQHDLHKIQRLQKELQEARKYAGIDLPG